MKIYVKFVCLIFFVCFIFQCKKKIQKNDTFAKQSIEPCNSWYFGRPGAAATRSQRAGLPRRHTQCERIILFDSHRTAHNNNNDEKTFAILSVRLPDRAKQAVAVHRLAMTKVVAQRTSQRRECLQRRRRRRKTVALYNSDRKKQFLKNYTPACTNASPLRK